jgi:hypothetical protein
VGKWRHSGILCKGYLYKKGFHNIIFHYHITYTFSIFICWFHTIPYIEIQFHFHSTKFHNLYKIDIYAIFLKNKNHRKWGWGSLYSGASKEPINSWHIFEFLGPVYKLVWVGLDEPTSLVWTIIRHYVIRSLTNQHHGSLMIFVKLLSSWAFHEPFLVLRVAKSLIKANTAFSLYFFQEIFLCSAYFRALFIPIFSLGRLSNNQNYFHLIFMIK